MLKNMKLQTPALTSPMTSAQTSDAVNIGQADGFFAMAVIADATPALKTFSDTDVTVATDKIAITAHGFITGLKVAATTTGTLPGGLSATNYYVIKADADTIKLASSLANALAGTAVDITSAAGGGTHTLTPAALSGASAKLQVSIDGTNWADLASSSQNITASGNLYWTADRVYYRYLRLVHAMSAGMITNSFSVQLKG